MAALTYEVVACEFPIVYTDDGDNDPSGFLYTLRSYLPLLDFARARWADDDEFLPRTHEQSQWLQIVVDGLPRYEMMRARLPEGDPLLGYGITVLPLADAEVSFSSAREQNLHATVDEILAALALITSGAGTALPPSREAREQWTALFAEALTATKNAFQERLAKLEVDDEATLRELARRSGLSLPRVRRLLLNDHKTDVTGLGAQTPAFDRFNPLKTIPVVRPLVLRAALGQSVEVRFENRIRDRRVGMHLQGDGIGSTRHGLAFGSKPPFSRRPTSSL